MRSEKGAVWRCERSCRLITSNRKPVLEWNEVLCMCNETHPLAYKIYIALPIEIPNSFSVFY
jgi:hypothetical protein